MIPRTSKGRALVLLEVPRDHQANMADITQAQDIASLDIASPDTTASRRHPATARRDRMVRHLLASRRMRPDALRRSQDRRSPVMDNHTAGMERLRLSRRTEGLDTTPLRRDHRGTKYQGAVDEHDLDLHV
jgi:hypothetical protein